MAAVPVGLLLVGVGGVQHRQIPQGLADPLSLYLSDIYTVPANLAGTV